MPTKFLTFAATGLFGLTVGFGVAAAQNDDAPESDPVESMDEMHAAMRDQMPSELAEQCDEMHSAMGESMGSMDAEHMGSMGAMRSGPTGSQHAEHHAQEQRGQ